MYPTITEFLEKAFGISIPLPIQTYGFFVALAFISATFFLMLEIKRKIFILAFSIAKTLQYFTLVSMLKAGRYIARSPIEVNAKVFTVFILNTFKGLSFMQVFTAPAFLFCLSGCSGRLQGGGFTCGL